MEWYEPPEFSRAYAKVQNPRTSILPHIFCFASIAIVLFMVSFPENITDLVGIFLISLAATFLPAFGQWVMTQAPKNIIIDEQRVIVGDNATNLADIAFAVVGTLEIEEAIFSVMRIQTIDGRVFVAGLNSKIEPSELARILEEHGILIK